MTNNLNGPHPSESNPDWTGFHCQKNLKNGRVRIDVCSAFDSRAAKNRSFESLITITLFSSRSVAAIFKSGERIGFWHFRSINTYKRWPELCVLLYVSYYYYYDDDWRTIIFKYFLIIQRIILCVLKLIVKRCNLESYGLGSGKIYFD
jgi:hypothetical protein